MTDGTFNKILETPIRVGIVGLGRSGWGIHASCLKNDSMYSVNAVADIDTIRLTEAKNDFNCGTHLDYSELMHRSDIDIVIVASPSKYHYQMAKTAIEAGKHVILEKPIAPSLEKAYELRDMSEKYGTLVIPFFNFRFVREYQIIRSVLDSGVIGRPYLIKRQVGYYNRRDDWQSMVEEEGGIINAAATHHIDQVLQITKEKPVQHWVDCRRLVSKGDAPDHCKIIMKFPSGCVTDVEVSWAQAFQGLPWLIYGDKGAIKQTGNKLECTWFDEARVECKAKSSRSYFSNESIQWNHRAYELDRDYSAGITNNFFSDLANTLLHGNTVPVTIDSVINTMKTLEEITDRVEIVK